MLKKILLASIFVITAISTIARAESDLKTVASKAYVDTKIETKQLKIPAAGQPNVGAGETVMTYTATGNGQIGERGLYSDISSYNATTDGDKLITASALNATFTNLPTTPTTKLECANQADGCTLWTIVDQTAYTYQLPDGYTRLQYIESSGTQYIDTGIKITSDDIIETTFQNRNVAVFGALYGVFAAGEASAFYANGTYYSYDATNTKVNTNIAVDTARHNVVHDFVNGTLKIDNISFTFAPFTFANTANNYLFGRYYDGSYGYLFSGIVKMHKITRNGIAVLDLIPCKNANNVVGMYDLVSGQFFTNAGTGDFIAGPPVN